MDPSALVPRMLHPDGRRELYRVLDTAAGGVALVNAVDRAAAGAEASAGQLREIVEAVLAEGYEELAEGFVRNPNMPEDYLVELCERGMLTAALRTSRARNR